MKTHICNMAHSDVQATFNRHLPHWKAMGQNLLVVHPSGKTIEAPGIPTMTIGKAQHAGIDAINRFKYMFGFFASAPYDQYLFYEYDAISLAPSIPELPDNTLAGNFFCNTEKTFTSSAYPHPPLMFNRGTAEKIYKAMMSIPNNAESGMWDRFIGRAIDDAGVQRMGFLESGLGYSANTIVPAFYPHMINSIKAGAIHLHGIKTKECYDLAIRTYGETKQ